MAHLPRCKAANSKKLLWIFIETGGSRLAVGCRLFYKTAEGGGRGAKFVRGGGAGRLEWGDANLGSID